MGAWTCAHPWRSETSIGYPPLLLSALFLWGKSLTESRTPVFQQGWQPAGQRYLLGKMALWLQALSRPIWGSSRPPVTLALAQPMPFPGLQEHLHPCRHIHINKNKIIFQRTSNPPVSAKVIGILQTMLNFYLASLSKLYFHVYTPGTFNHCMPLQPYYNLHSMVQICIISGKMAFSSEQVSQNKKESY